jgi:hypothetical protein
MWRTEHQPNEDGTWRVEAWDQNEGEYTKYPNPIKQIKRDNIPTREEAMRAADEVLKELEGK